ncbi:hypothetical protein WME99_41810 [Sorangium sp. So ce136]|uniref:hypothetical protein n=1 Tax=Sorangium sp. So ce136 TaxID=3133284 RepID=UPI003F033AE9
MEAILERNGYSIIYQQRGPTKNEGLGRWLRNTMPSDTFLAIDKALLAGLARGQTDELQVEHPLTAVLRRTRSTWYRGAAISPPPRPGRRDGAADPAR